jgi:hypothetical protein
LDCTEEVTDEEEKENKKEYGSRKQAIMKFKS